MEIETTLSFLQASQLKKGFFNAYIDNKTTQTTFITSLILNCLTEIRSHPLTTTIVHQGITFLLSEKSNHWSWNYYQKEAQSKLSHTYPDDWDDTASALIALSLHQPQLITPQALAQITKLLIRSEVKPGGPYYTWLLKEQTSNSPDIDPVVNSNINYFLSLYNIHLKPLTDYIDSAIKSKTYTSLYYDQPEVIIYFLSRGYTGTLTSNLIKDLLQFQNKHQLWKNDLITALAVSSLIRLKAEPSLYHKAISHLKTLAHANHWQPYPLYIEEKMPESLLVGSPALTAAFVAEALSLYEEDTKNSKVKNQSNSISTTIHSTIVTTVKNHLSFFPKSQREKINLVLDRILIKDPGQQITLLPYFFAQALPYQKNIGKNLIVELGTTNLYGWLAYTSYDNILDHDDGPELLSLANTCLRKVITSYQSLVSTSAFAFFQNVMDRMEVANAWEYTNFRLKDKLMTEETLPLYPKHLLYDKSLPHAFSCLALILQKYQLDSPAFLHTLTFFKHYLSARQLNDDAHDWEDDLKKSFLNSVAVSLLHSYFQSQTNISRINVEAELPNLQAHFLNFHINGIAKNINHHLAMAEKELKILISNRIILNFHYLKSLLDPLKQATKIVFQETANIKAFQIAFRS